ncbi:hypothetical protein [Paenibacillus qinlingensis]|uniref:Uncharacterized protein n=1 Tax=Paenibacillus qinlingensis TaxID=1837343 RepID=A0ABU1NXJ2_9BACL|nr:hypothetical protein [Paenibacillus qinlingensis]MDR6552223.1 hypothetical protein [Paenibacillus qinlingensis]
MEQNSSLRLRRMREKHRRIVGLQAKLIGVEQVEKHEQLKVRNNVLLLEQTTTYHAKPPSITELEADVWELRKQFILQIANRRNGKVRLVDVAAECNVNIRVAAEWLIRLSTEGTLSLIAGQQHTMTYLVKEVGGAQK